MTTIAKDVAAKFAVAFVAVAMIFTMFATPALAAEDQTIGDLQALINSLMEQIAALEGTMSSDDDSSMMSSSDVCPYTWTRDLSSGSTGADVMKLQQFLNDNADTRVAAMGAGSAGNETDYYGPATAAAVSKFQVMYRADVLTPGGLVNPTGYYGPSSRAKANALCVAAPMMDDDEGEMTEEEEEMEEEENVSLSGEASLNDAEVDDAADDEIEEGSENAEAAEITLEFEDGDAEISRMDISLDSGDTSDPWDVFESISLWVDGDMIAEENADDEDDYQNDEETLRFSGLDIVAMEDEDVDIVVAVTLQNNIDAADRDTYTVTLEALRFFDADGVATTESVSDTPLSGAGTASFTVVVEGVDDEVTAKTSSDDPDSTTFPVEDTSKSDWYSVFIFDLDTDDSVNDIEINTLVLNVLTAENTNAADAGYNDLVDDVELVIDGVTIDDVTVGGTFVTAGTAILTFDVDGDVTIDAGDRVEVELRLRFNSLPVAEEGATVLASIDSLDTTIIDAEGADNILNPKLGGSATGDLHTLRTEGLILEIDSITAVEDVRDTGGGDLDYGTYTFVFDVTAFEEDFYTDEDADVINYRVVVDGVDALAASSTATLSIDDSTTAATADERLGDGQTATYTFVVETETTLSGAVEVVIDSIDYSAADDVTEELNVTANPEDDWTSSKLILN